MNFMTFENVVRAIKDIKMKNSEGWNGIHQRILIKGIDYLAEPFSVLFNKIYNFIDYDWLNQSYKSYKI